MSKLTEKIDAAMTEHLEGLIRGWELKSSEAAWWVTLLGMAKEQSAPVRKARFYGFKFINRRADIDEAIAHLAQM